MSDTETVVSSVLDRVHSVLEVLGVVLLLFIGVITTLQIVARTHPAFPDFIWVGEIARYALVIMTIVGVPYAMRTDDHISVRPLLEALPSRRRTALILTTNAMVVAFCLVLAYASLLVSRRTLGNPLPTVRWLNYGYVNVLLAAMILLTAAYTIEQSVGLWRELRSPEATDGEAGADGTVGVDPDAKGGDG